MSADYRFVRYYPGDGQPQDDEVRFEDAANLHAYVLAFLGRKLPGQLHVHLPSTTSDQERAVISEFGAHPI